MDAGEAAYGKTAHELAAFRVFYEAHVCSALARADSAIFTLHAFLAAPRTHTFFVDPEVVGGVEATLSSCASAV